MLWTLAENVKIFDGLTTKTYTCTSKFKNQGKLTSMHK